MKTIKIAFVLLVFCSIIAQAQTKKITWMPWVKVPLEVKNKLKTIKTYNKTETIYSTIISAIKDGKKVGSSVDIEIAIIDLDGDGKPGYIVAYSGSLYCGTAGCLIEVYEKDGKMQISINDEIELIKAAKNGITSARGKFIKLESAL